MNLQSKFNLLTMKDFKVCNISMHCFCLFLFCFYQATSFFFSLVYISQRMIIFRKLKICNLRSDIWAKQSYYLSTGNDLNGWSLLLSIFFNALFSAIKNKSLWFWKILRYFAFSSPLFYSFLTRIFNKRRNQNHDLKYLLNVMITRVRFQYLAYKSTVYAY